MRYRILHLLPWITSGGVERRRLELARGLDRERFDQRLVCSRGFTSLLAEFGKANVRVDEIGGSWAPYDLASAWRIGRIVREYRPDLIHGAVFEGVNMATLVRLASPQARVVIEEIGDGVHRTWRGHALFRFHVRCSHQCVAVSRFAAQQLIDRGGVSRDAIRVIVNGVSPPETPTSKVLEAARLEWRIGSGDFVVGSMGRIDDEHKRFSVLLRAAAHASRAVPNLRVLIAGSGKDLPALQALAKSCGIAEQVVFTGHQATVGVPLHLMDLFVMPSSRESFGLAAVEAMACGLPVVASSVGGLREIVVHDETGYLVPPLDVDALSNAIVELHGDPTRRQSLGQAGRRRAQEHFGSIRYVREVESLYEGLLNPTQR